MSHRQPALSCFGEEHHSNRGAGTVDIRTQTLSSGSMEQGKPFSATDSPLVDFDAVCQKVRAAVEPARAHAVSLHDEQGDVLWLSESSMGPDEHNAVREAIEAFSNPSGPPVLVSDLGDSRSAVLLRAVNARRAMVGVIMIIMDARVVRQDARGALKIMTPKLQRALVDFAAMRPDSAPPPATPARAGAAAPLALVNDTSAPPAASRPAAMRTPPAAPARTPSPRPPASRRRQPCAPRRRHRRASRPRQPPARRRHLPALQRRQAPASRQRQPLEPRQPAVHRPPRPRGRP